MAKVLLAMVCLMFTHSFAASSIVVDKGVIEITLNKSGKPYEISHRMKPGCKPDIFIKEKRNALVVSHPKDKCPSGATFFLTLNPPPINQVSLRDGVVESNKNTFKHKIVEYAGQEAVGDFGNEAMFTINVDAGVLKF